MGTPFEPLLRKLRNFTALTAIDVSLVRGLPGQPSNFPRKTDLTSRLDGAGVFHLLADGWAARFKYLSDGQRQITGFLLPGDFIDWPPDNSRDTGHGVRTLTTCRVLSVEAHSIDELLWKAGPLSKALWDCAAFEQLTLREWIVGLGRRNARERISRLICELHDRMTMIGRAADGSFEFPLRQSDVADATGLTSVHVNRTLKSLKRDKLIDGCRPTLSITDQVGLRELAQFSSHYLHGGQN
jgi:CRP-like cAMP-binding protein